MCRVQSCGRVEGATRLVVLLPSQQQRRRSDRAAPAVSRETGVSCSARARSAARSAISRLAHASRGRRGPCRLPAARTCATSSVSAAGVMPSIRPAWPMVRGRCAASFWRDFVRQPGQRRIVEIVRQLERSRRGDRPRCRRPGGRDRRRTWRRSRAARRSSASKLGELRPDPRDIGHADGPDRTAARTRCGAGRPG